MQMTNNLMYVCYNKHIMALERQCTKAIEKGHFDQNQHNILTSLD